MKVLMTADTVGGVWTYALELCAGLARHGATVELATMGDLPRAEQIAAAGALPNVTLHASAFRLEWMNDPWDDVAAAGEWLLELAAATRPDVIHLNGYAHAALPWPAPVLVVAHSCVLSWWRAVHDADAPTDWKPYTATVRHGLAAADMVAAPTRAMLLALTRHYGSLPRTSTVPNGIGARRAASGSKQPFVLAVGRAWDASKNFTALNAAAGRITWPIKVAGDPHAPDGGTVELDALDLLGSLAHDALNAHYADAAILAHPALYEPFGLAPLEAALHGCALVLGDIPSLREVWQDAAVFVPPRDVAALAAAIEMLASDDVLRNGMAAQARHHARRYSAERMASAYKRSYDVLLARTRPAEAACA